jgi:hypothetical protein
VQRELEAGVGDRGSNALPRLPHRGIRQADEREGGKPAVHVHLHVNLTRGDPDHGEGASDGEHAPRLEAAGERMVRERCGFDTEAWSSAC